jgi:hypothetical protein
MPGGEDRVPLDSVQRAAPRRITPAEAFDAVPSDCSQIGRERLGIGVGREIDLGIPDRSSWTALPPTPITLIRAPSAPPPPRSCGPSDQKKFQQSRADATFLVLPDASGDLRGAGKATLVV